jgi:hypothetical protein
LNFYILNTTLEDFLHDKSNKKKLEAFEAIENELLVMEKEYIYGSCQDRELIEKALDIINDIYMFLDELETVYAIKIRREIYELGRLHFIFEQKRETSAIIKDVIDELVTEFASGKIL